MTTSRAKEVRFFVNEKAGVVSGLVLRPNGARVLLVLAHGAGAGMRHRFMEDAAIKLATRGVATLRYQFPYMEKRIKRPDSESTLIDTVRAAIVSAKKLAGDLPLFAGGKSMGGRMTSLAAAQQPLDGVRGMIYFGFPLHAAGNPGAERGNHLSQIDVPMLFLQGSRDALADLQLLKPLCRKLGKRIELFVIAGGDHSFHMLKSSGKSDEQALNDAVEKTVRWMKEHV
ncbi:MAG: alpha/beta hydrolase family protein [Candidatus Binatia bacterium]